MKEIKETVVENKKGNAKITRENQTKYHTEVDLIPDVEYKDVMWRRIKDLMKDKNINYETLSRILGYEHGSSLSRIKKGEREFSLQHILKLSKYFNVSIDYLLGRTEIKELHHIDAPEEYESNFHCLISTMLNFLPEDRRQPFMEKVLQDNK
jgi:transcriptional regulator with XRE-family HTH domain